MFSLTTAIILRIFSNSYLNVFQKFLTSRGEPSSIINFYSYLGLTLIGCAFCHNIMLSSEAIPPIIIMGILGALGNYFIIKALSCGELSVLAPINAYKPVVALIFGIIMLGEIPNIIKLLGIILIIFGTFILIWQKYTPSKSYIYRLLALLFSGIEAIFIKKVILLTNIESAFLYWALAGLVFSIILAIKHPLKIKKENIKPQVMLIIMIAIMQYSTNYVFSRINVAYALALFQLSTLVSVILGVNIFKEKGIVRKFIASLIMLTGAVIIIL